MADTLVHLSVSAGLDSENLGLQGPYWLNKDKGIIVFADVNREISFSRTIDEGANWSKTVIEIGTTDNLVCWFDQETPGDSGSIVHLFWLDDDDDEAKYVDIDINDGSVGTIRTIASGLTMGLSNTQRIAITKTVGGNIIAAFSTSAEIECYKSDDNFATAGTDIADVFETGTERDWVLLFPINTADNNDACAIFWDRSADEISIKMYDDSGNSWTESSISGSMVDDTSHINMDASVRHSDKHILLGAHSDDDTVGDDLKTWDITPDDISSPTITAKTNIFTDQAESAQCAVLINQQNDDVYVAYLKGGTWTSLTDVVFHKSTDGMGSWGGEQSYSETTDDNRLVHGGRTIGNSGGRIQWSFYNDDTAAIYVNLVNDIEIVATAVGTNTQINIADAWKDVDSMQINIGDTWKDVTEVKQNIGDTWKTVF